MKFALAAIALLASTINAETLFGCAGAGCGQAAAESIQSTCIWKEISTDDKLSKEACLVVLKEAMNKLMGIPKGKYLDEYADKFRQ